MSDTIPPVLSRTTSKLVISRPTHGISPSGFERLHVEMLPREVGRLIGYDPRVLVHKPKRGRKAAAELVPHNVSQAIVDLQNQVQRSIDSDRVEQMVAYLVGAMEHGKFADWGAIELMTTKHPDTSKLEQDFTAAFETDADYFIADGQHRYCALLDFITNYPQYADRFTQAVTISILPEEKLTEWAGQEFHDRNFFSVPVRAGKALSVDTRDPVNALAKDMARHPVIVDAGGVAYERDSLLKNDSRFISHSMLHRFVKGFLLGRPGLDKGVDTRLDITFQNREDINEYFTALGTVLPWKGSTPDRDSYLTRTSAVISALAVLGHDLYSDGLTMEQKVKKLTEIAKLDWNRTNLNLVGVLGSEKDGKVAPNASRQSIDATIRYLREKLSIQPKG